VSSNPIIALLHAESSACQFLAQCNADICCIKWQEEGEFQDQIINALTWMSQEKSKMKWTPKLNPLEEYTSAAGTRKLLNMIKAIT